MKYVGVTWKIYFTTEMYELC